VRRAPPRDPCHSFATMASQYFRWRVLRADGLNAVDIVLVGRPQGRKLRLFISFGDVYKLLAEPYHITKTTFKRVVEATQTGEQSPYKETSAEEFRVLKLHGHLPAKASKAVLVSLKLAHRVLIKMGALPDGTAASFNTVLREGPKRLESLTTYRVSTAVHLLMCDAFSPAAGERPPPLAAGRLRDPRGQAHSGEQEARGGAAVLGPGPELVPP
jgi:hypothetical protein